MPLKQGICKIKGCNRPQTSKGIRSGKRRYSTLCSAHHALKRGIRKASICEWDGPCDKHRARHGKDGGRYRKGNVLVLCPNCHRLVHRELLKVK